MNDYELLLSDEYQTLTQTVQSAYREKKELEEEFKAKFEEYKAQKAEIENRVKAAHDEWEAWKARQTGATAASTED